MADFDVLMTGSEDYQKRIAMAICGWPGSGKTIFSSTAPKPFFIFFRENPQIMSIADRYHLSAKVLNKYGPDGKIIKPVWEVLNSVCDFLESPQGDEIDTVVVDTGDELFQAMKKGRTQMNKGKWAIADWGWIADMYREVMDRVLNLNKNVIVTFHMKNTQAGEDGEIVRELALQGAAKDEAAGWFDIVGVLDSWEESTENGNITRRGILTQSTARYPFAKDHSGKLPKVFDLSDGFVDDYVRLQAIIFKSVPKTKRQLIDVIEEEIATKKKPSNEGTPIPTPKDVAEKKGADPETVQDAAPDEAPVAPAAETVVAPVEEPDTQEPAEEPETVVAEEPDDPEVAEPADDPVAEAAAVEEVEKVLGGTPEFQVCVECGDPISKVLQDEVGEPVLDEQGNKVMVPDKDWEDLSHIRYRKILCRTHFQAKKTEGS